MNTPVSPIGLYWVGGVVVQSDDGPVSASKYAFMNEGIKQAEIGAIFPDSTVDFGPGKPKLFFNPKTRRLSISKSCKGSITSCLQVFVGRVGFYVEFEMDSGKTWASDKKEHKLDAYLDAFEKLTAVQLQ